MSISINAVASGGVYVLPVKSPGQAQPTNLAQAAHRTSGAEARVAAAQQALDKANSAVEQDRRNHSPGCVACDQKLVNKAEGQLNQAKAATDDQIVQALPPPGSMIDVTA